MKRIKIFLACGLLLASTLSFAEQQSSEIATKLDQLLQKTSTFQASFTQTTISENNSIVQKSSGTVQFQRPGKFRWETLKPTHQVIVTNNQWLWIYDIDLKQVTKRQVNRDMLTPARVLSSDSTALLKRFKVEMGQSAGRVKFILLAKSKKANFKEVIIFFVNDTLTGLSVINQIGQTNNFHFSDVKTNQPLNASLFDFTPPAGVDVLRSQ